MLQQKHPHNQNSTDLLKHLTARANVVPHHVTNVKDTVILEMVYFRHAGKGDGVPTLTNTLHFRVIHLPLLLQTSALFGLAHGSLCRDKQTLTTYIQGLFQNSLYQNMH